MKVGSILAVMGLGLALYPSAFSMTYPEARAIAKSMPLAALDASNHGKLCELLGVKIIQDLNPDAEVLNGVEYRKQGRTLGELDLVVIRDYTVTDVIEVKCMASYSKAAHKADDQLARFASHIGRCDVDFSLGGSKLPCDAFGSTDIRLGKMSYTDASAVGFDYDLGFSRKDILALIKDARASYSTPD
jgi:hypothetical protein